MEKTIDTLNPSAPLEKRNIDLEQRLQKKLKEVNCFNNSVNSIEKKVTYFKDKNHKSKKR